MTSVGWSIVLLLMLNALTCGWSQHHHRQHHRRHHSSGYRSNENVGNFDGEETNDAMPISIIEKTRKSLKLEDSKAPFSTRRLEKMLEKAILKIIMGDLDTADMMLLKSLNYSLEDILEIREYELGKRKEEERRREERSKFERERVKSRTESLTYAARADRDDSEKRKEFYEKSVDDEDLDYEEFNRQAVVDYEKMEVQQPWSDPGISDYVDPVRESKERRSKDDENSQEEGNDSVDNARRSFDRAMGSHVIFKIRYDDSEFDSSSDEKSRMAAKRDRESSKISKNRGSGYVKENTSSSAGNSFHTSTAATFSSPSSSPSFSSFASSVSSSSSSSSNPVVYRLDDFNAAKSDYSPERNRLGTTSSPEVQGTSTSEPRNATSTDSVLDDEGDSRNETRDEDSSKVSVKRVSEYEGLEWVEDDVYRVIPSLADTLADYENVEENEPADYEDDSAGVPYERPTTASLDENENDTAEYQNDMSDSVKLFVANTNGSTDNQSVSTYQQLALAHRRDQGQRVIEDIKSRVLALTRRFNVSSNLDTVQREMLTGFSPKCQIPRNTDPEAWWDPFSMNLHFQLNLTSGQHVVAARLRIYKLPQENLTSSSVATSTSLGDEQDEEDEKKIRISVYYYTKSLRKHRVKKRLMDSLVTPLTSKGTHLALDVRQGLRFWRLNPRNPHGNGGNHGLGIQVEDQDGRPLKPALYIHQPSCSNGDVDQKTTTYLHSSFEPVLVTFAS